LRDQPDRAVEQASLAAKTPTGSVECMAAVGMFLMLALRDADFVAAVLGLFGGVLSTLTSGCVEPFFS
jgi:hypothetical protein